MPLIACSLHPPLLRFLALSALAAWQLLEHSQQSSYHQLTEVCESAPMCKCMFGKNRTRVCMQAYVCRRNLLFLLRLSAPVFSKTIQTMSQTGFYYTASFVWLFYCGGSSFFSSLQQWGLNWYWMAATLLPLPNIPGVWLHWNHIKDTNFFLFKGFFFPSLFAICHWETVERKKAWAQLDSFFHWR